MKRVYLDTTVLVFYFVSRFDPGFSKKSKEFLGKVEAGNYEALISLFALMELVKQFRELLIKSNICMKADWESSIKKALEALYKMRNVRIIEAMNGEAEQTNVTNLVLTHSEIAWDGFNIINKYPGSVKQRDNLFYHDGLHPIDAVHLALAKKTGCSAIATFDRDFRETDAELPSILLMEDYF
jgi:predicted nucleic acid-binding protein